MPDFLFFLLNRNSIQILEIGWIFSSRAFGAPVSLISNIHEEIQENFSVLISKAGNMLYYMT